MRIFSPAICPYPQPVLWKFFSLWLVFVLCGECRARLAPAPSAPGASRYRRRRELLGTGAPVRLLANSGNPTRADGPAAFTDREPKPLFHSDRLNQLHLHLGVVAREHHLGAFRQVDHTGHVGGTEVELRTVVVEERRVPAALVLGQDVDLRLELGVRGVGARPDDDLPALHFLALDAAQ